MRKDYRVLDGQKFGRLLVLHREAKTYPPRAWCRCDCGNEKSIRIDSILKGSTVSCGCYRRSLGVGKKHGRSKEKLFNTWIGMKFRCFNKKSISYSLYGERGISVCDEWLDYENFREWSLSNGYEEGLTIDRINPDGNYVPTNCRWVTQKDNSNNKRTNVYLTIDGETKTLKQWSEIAGVKYDTFHNRYKSGYRGEDLFKQKLGGTTRDEKGRYSKDGARAGTG